MKTTNLHFSGPNYRNGNYVQAIWEVTDDDGMTLGEVICLGSYWILPIGSTKFETRWAAAKHLAESLGWVIRPQG